MILSEAAGADGLMEAADGHEQRRTSKNRAGGATKNKLTASKKKRKRK
jgi:hypothetical protein